MDIIAIVLALGAILGAFSLGYARGKRAPLRQTPFPWARPRLHVVRRYRDEHADAGVG